MKFIFVSEKLKPLGLPFVITEFASILINYVNPLNLIASNMTVLRFSGKIPLSRLSVLPAYIIHLHSRQFHLTLFIGSVKKEFEIYLIMFPSQFESWIE